MDFINADLKELCEILEIGNKAPVHYVNRKHVDKEKIIFCICTPASLERDVENGEYDSQKDYDRSKCGLYIPDIAVYEFVTMQIEGNPDSLDMIIKAIAQKMQFDRLKSGLIYTVFCILHELGHWHYYKNSGMSDYEFYLHDMECRKEAVDLGERISKMPNDHPDKSMLVEKQNIMYRNIPSEKAADQFALNHLEEAMERIRKSL